MTAKPMEDKRMALLYMIATASIMDRINIGGRQTRCIVQAWTWPVYLHGTQSCRPYFLKIVSSCPEVRNSTIAAERIPAYSVAWGWRGEKAI